MFAKPNLQVLTWRGLNSLKDSNTNTSEGGAGLALGPAVLIGAALLSMATSASMNYLYFRVSTATFKVFQAPWEFYRG